MHRCKPTALLLWATGLLMLGLTGESDAQILRRGRRWKSCDNVAANPVRPVRATLFDGKSLDGWQAANEDVFDKAGKVEVQNGRIELGEGAPATGIRRTDKPPRINYEISLEAMRTDGSDFFCGLTFPVRDAYCSLIIGGWGGGVVGLSNIDDMPAVNNETSQFRDFENNRWYKIRLRVTQTKIEAWIDDKRVIDLETKDRRFDIWWEQQPLRPLGIATWYTAAALRNISLRNIDPKNAE